MTSYRETRKKLSLLKAKQQSHTLDTIHEAMKAVRVRFPRAGAQEFASHLFAEHAMCVSRYDRHFKFFCHGPQLTEFNTHSHLIVNWFRIFEPDLIRQRKARNLKRRRFWAAGVNDMLAVDQHDKWKRFGLALHTGIDPFSGRTHWIKVYWTNNNPKVVVSYYFTFIKEGGCMYSCPLFLPFY